jgi:hypothetical protein
VNCTLPRGDRGHRSPDPCRASGPPGSLPRARRLVGRTPAPASNEATEMAQFAPVCARFAKGGPVTPPDVGGRDVGAALRDLGFQRASRFRQMIADDCR